MLNRRRRYPEEGSQLHAFPEWRRGREWFGELKPAAIHAGPSASREAVRSQRWQIVLSAGVTVICSAGSASPANVEFEIDPAPSTASRREQH